MQKGEGKGVTTLQFTSKLFVPQLYICTKQDNGKECCSSLAIQQVYKVNNLVMEKVIYLQQSVSLQKTT